MEGSAKQRRICENDGTARGASSSTHTSTEGQEKDTSSGYDYEVFLSFRGPDTRASFTDHLYTRLDDAGIRTFKDDESLRVGERFAPKLLQAINQSKILIPIFSKDYASSVWCLKELVQMVECEKTGRQKIMPIFYDVAPSEVRHQTGDYENAFLSHASKKRYDQKTIGEWKAALRAVGEINGHDLQSMPNRREGEFARILTQKVFSELKKAHLVVSDCLVTVDNQVDAIMGMIGAQTSETRIIGIHGMGGIGKTTIAKIIYNRLSHDFESCCFLSDIRETSKGNGIPFLQNELISSILKTKCTDIKNIDEGTQTIKDRLSNKRVLLLLDDVEDHNHMRALVGKRDWFGKGSKLLITTRKKDVLIVREVDCTYEVETMDDHQSLQLFSKHAFGIDCPLDEYIIQSKRAIQIAGGLPLALEVIGSLLSGKNKEVWNATLEKLANVPHANVQGKLKISYDTLDDGEKDIFLDIACLFIGYEKDILIHFWDASKLYPKVAMEVLQDMSLIKIKENNRVWMHDQLRDLGRMLVCKKKKEKQSRVWYPEEALDLLRRHEGKTKVEALRLHFDHERQYRFTCKDFTRISNVRFLEVDGSEECFRAEERLLWHESSSDVLATNVFQENAGLLPRLRWLSWHGIPPTFTIANFSMEDVVILDLSWSKITHDWQGWSHMEVMKNLKRLILKGCESLTEIDRSICHLTSLVSLDVSFCNNLRRLPDELGRDLASLEYLSLERCELLKRLPNTIGNLKSLIELDINGTGIKELPDSIGNLKSLVKLDISLTKIKELPDSIGKLKNLKIVKMSVIYMSKIPDALWTIEKLEEIYVEMHIFSVEVEIGNCIYKNQSLRILRLLNARIYVVPRLPESLITLQLEDLYMDMFPDLSNLTNLKELKLRFSRHDDGGESDGPVEEYLMPRWIGNLSKLENLDLHSNYVTILPTDISSLLPRLRRLHLRCPNLRCLPSPPSSLSTLHLYSKCVTTLPADISSCLPRLQGLELECPNLRCLPSLPSSLSSLRLVGCKSLGSLGDQSNLKNLSILTINDSAISKIRGLDGSENLDLQLSELEQVGILPDLSNINQLRRLHVYRCSNLVEIQGELPQFLEQLEILKCGSLQKLPDLSSLKRLRQVEIKHCGKLNVEAIYLLCSEKAIRFVGDEKN